MNEPERVAALFVSKESRGHLCALSWLQRAKSVRGIILMVCFKRWPIVWVYACVYMREWQSVVCLKDFDFWVNYMR